MDSIESQDASIEPERHIFVDPLTVARFAIGLTEVPVSQESIDFVATKMVGRNKEKKSIAINRLYEYINQLPIALWDEDEGKDHTLYALRVYQSSVSTPAVRIHRKFSSIFN